LTYGGFGGGGPVNPFGDNPFGGGQPPYRPVPPPPPPPRENSALATLSVVFAFVFAPAGAVLGHLALSQNTRSQTQKARALVGVTLSYAFIVVAIVSVVVWAVIGNDPDATSSTAASTSATAATSKPSPPPEPTLTSADLPRLPLSLDEVSDIMQIPAGMVEKYRVTDVGTGNIPSGNGDPIECAGAVLAAQAPSYEGSGQRAFYEVYDGAAQGQGLVDQAVVAFDSAAAAQSFVAKSVDQWRRCAGKKFTASTAKGSVSWTVAEPVQVGGMTLFRNTLHVEQDRPDDRVLAAKANVVVDLVAFKVGLGDQATTIASRILQRIPG
jgi:hypothetical protein